jgi:hypothetical protein
VGSTWKPEFAEIAAATGAMLVGRRTCEVGNRMAAADQSGGRTCAVRKLVAAS